MTLDFPSDAYAATADELGRRILALIPAFPRILEMHDPWDLFRVPGFECDDLGPSMAQAEAALAWAKQEWQAARDREETR